MWLLYKKKFSRGFYFREFRELNPKRENKNSRNIFPSFINERKVCITNNTALGVNAKLLNLEGCHCTLGNHKDDFNMQWR